MVGVKWGGITHQDRSLGFKLDAAASSCFSYGKPAYQMVVVCGNNNGARTNMEVLNWGKVVDVKVIGFFNSLDNYMRESNAIETKT